MKKILITGATGNIGTEVIHALINLNSEATIYAGVRDVSKDKVRDKVELVQFDFTIADSYKMALNNCDVLFLLRPPQISDTEKYFKPIIETCLEKDVKHIVFLSVQGVEKSSIIPHHKIEQLIVDSKIHYTFLRPAYFMQNFTTTLRSDLVNKKSIYLPAGDAKFTLVDVRDIGAVAANVLTNTSMHINKAYDLTCDEKLTFSEMARMLSSELECSIKYSSPNLVRFFLTKKREGIPAMFILVMIMLHYLPRFQSEPQTTDWIKKITGRQPITFTQFINDNGKRLI